MKGKNALRWIWSVLDSKKIHILALTLIRGMAGFIGVLYALLLRALVDSAVGKDATSFRRDVVFYIILIIVQLGINALVRWLYSEAFT